MGGSAFTDPKDPSKSLNTPRMPPHIYQYARDRALHILNIIYAHAQCPIEAPAKADYGDVDILVASPHDQANTDTASLAAALGATQYLKNNPLTNFALPWPTAEELSANLGHVAMPAAQPKIAGSSPSTVSNTSLGAQHGNIGLGTADSPQYIQLDLYACPTSEQFYWELFHQAHGDLWNILGGMIRPYGLVVNHVGLHLRLSGVYNISRDQRMVQLTNSPSAVLKFLDLGDSYWTPFENLDAMFVYAASCRFYDPKAYEGKEDLKANGRLRMKKRPTFMKWYEGYLAQHKEDEPGRSARVDREEVIEEAKRVFGVEKEYEEKRAKGLRTMGEEKLWSDVRKGLPLEGLRIGIVMRGVKREIVGKTLAEETNQLSGMQQAYMEGRFDEIAEWVRADWEGIERRQNAYEKGQSTEHMLAKLEREKAKRVVDSAGPETGTRGADTSTFETVKMLEALGQ